MESPERSVRACVRPRTVRAVRVYSHVSRFRDSLRGWRSQERGGSNPPFRTSIRFARSVLHGVFRHSGPRVARSARRARIPLPHQQQERPRKCGPFSFSARQKANRQLTAEMRVAVSEHAFVPRFALQRDAHSPCRSRTEFPSGSQPYRRARRMSRDTSGRVEPADPRWRETLDTARPFLGRADSTTTITIVVVPP
jgi:hypothetical protein